MNINDFINVKGVEWGRYPYYDGYTYNEGSIYFATFGCEKGFQYKDFAEGMASINVSEKTNYLSFYNNGGLKEYYGDGLFKVKNNLASVDDFIRNKNNKIAIPTEEELRRLINSSDIDCFNGQLHIQPYEMINGVKTYKGDISIPFLGVVNYIADNVSTPTKYDVRNGLLKQVGIGFHKEVAPKNWTGTPPEGYPFVIERRNTDNSIILKYECYEGGYYYSDVFLLTSTIPKDENGNIITNEDTNGKTFARVLRIEIEAKTVEDDPSTPEVGDVEFLSFEIKTIKNDDVVEQCIYFENIACCQGDTAKNKDRGFMVLPIKYDGDINVNINGELLINDHTLNGYNQEFNDSTVPYFTISPFGIPEIINAKYNHTFTRPLSNGKTSIGTEMHIKEGVTDALKTFKNYDYLDGSSIKVKSLNSTDTSYWIVSNNEYLYISKDDNSTYSLIFEDRSLFGGDKTSVIDITVNIGYTEKHIVPDENFVLPSIYKPFYVKKLYTIEPYYVEYSTGYVNTYYFGVHTNVYNGIGLFAYKGIVEEEDKSDVPNGNTSEELPMDLTSILYKYFDGNPSFANAFVEFYSTYKYKDTYAIGVTDDSLNILNDYDEVVIGNSLAPLPIFRDKPLILSDYSNSVFDFLDYIPVEAESKTLKNLSKVRISDNFITVKEPNTKFYFNKEIHTEREIDFGNLFGKIFIGDCNPNTPENGFPSCVTDFETVSAIFQNSKKHGIRYYMVNQAFYENYIINSLSEYGKSEFINYTDEYCNNREYYDLNPHKVDFKYTDTWNSHAEGYSSITEAKMTFGLYPYDTNLTLTSQFVPTVVGTIEKQNTWSVYVDKECAKMYNVISSLLYLNEQDPYNMYKVSFWVQNSDAATIRIRVKLGTKRGVEGWFGTEAENNGTAPYKYVIIKPNEKRYVEFYGYPFKDDDIQLWICPEYKNLNTNSYYRISFRITQIYVENFVTYLPFFDMIPSLKNTHGYVYSGKDKDGNDGYPNLKAPIAIEMYTEDNMIKFNPMQICDSGSQNLDVLSDYMPLYLIGAYTPLTCLDGDCTDEESDYVRHIKYGTEILPQTNSISVILNYGEIERRLCKNYN